MPNPGRQLPPVRNRPPQPGLHSGLPPPTPHQRTPHRSLTGPGPPHPNSAPLPRKRPSPLMTSFAIPKPSHRAKPLQPSPVQPSRAEPAQPSQPSRASQAEPAQPSQPSPIPVTTPFRANTGLRPQPTTADFPVLDLPIPIPRHSQKAPEPADMPRSARPERSPAHLWPPSPLRVPFLAAARGRSPAPHLPAVDSDPNLGPAPSPKLAPRPNPVQSNPIQSKVGPAHSLGPRPNTGLSPTPVSADLSPGPAPNSHLGPS
jgi:hypothetical protein